MQKRKAQIPGYEKYAVDVDGVVYGQSGKPLKPAICRGGYKMVALCVGGKPRWREIHRIVAETFIHCVCAASMFVNHIDGGKLNNSVDNLEWVTPKGNSIHACSTLGVNVGARNGQAKRINKCDKSTLAILSSYPSIMDAARAICPSNARAAEQSIWRVLSGQRKSYKGFYWQYVSE